MSLEGARLKGDASAEAILKAVQDLQQRFAPKVAAIAASIETDASGNIVSSPENIARVDALISRMKGEFIDDKFTDAVIKYLESLDDVTDDVADAFSDFDVQDEVLRAIDRRAKAHVAAELTNPNSYPSMWANVADGLIYGVAVAAAVEVTVRTVSNVAATVDAGSAVKPTVENAPIMMQRAQTAAAAQEAGVEFFLFQGRPIPTTRTWCRDKEGHVWHIEEIREWGRQAADGQEWEGMVEGTNEQTIFTYLGGWYGERNSCRHVLVPVPRFKVPASDLERMKRKGLV